MNEKFLFLTSTRFWALIIGALSIYLKAKGILGESEMSLIATIMGGFIVVKSVDKLGKNIGSENNVTTTTEETSEILTSN
jgi:hypothetical protein